MPQNSLEDLYTQDGWHIKERITKELGSGGNFCSRDKVISKDGKKEGFMKAMDLSRAQNDLRAMQKLITEYLFEQDILQVCKERKMSRVITPIEVGNITCPLFAPPANVVYYAVFDMAEGDLRSSHLEISPTAKKWAPAFKALHHTAIGVNQLHKAEIAHQDIKPSNVLSFTPESYKVSDLGRVVDKKGNSPYKGLIFPGDNGYKPIEMFYGVTASEFVDRLSCDMFMVGSLAYQLIEDVQLNVAVLDATALLHSGVRQLTYEAALPFILSTFNTKLDEFKTTCTSMFGEKISALLVSIIGEMCHPDPAQRGASKTSTLQHQYDLERYVGKFSQLVLAAKVAGL